MSQAYVTALGRRLRAVRRQSGKTLSQVEQQSAGQLTVKAVSSWERGDRAVTVARLAELAEFYGVPTEDLLPPQSMVAAPAGSGRKLTLDLTRLVSLPARETGPLARYASTIRHQRDDYNGKILTIREQDLQSLAVMYHLEPNNMMALLTTWGVLSADSAAGTAHGNGEPLPRQTSRTWLG